jgi:hypothetical protein
MKKLFVLMLLLSAAPSALTAHEIKSDVKPGTEPAFDVTRAAAVTDGATATFVMEVAGNAGSVLPRALGALKGAKVNAYVWPTSLESASCGLPAQERHPCPRRHSPSGL